MLEDEQRLTREATALDDVSLDVPENSDGVEDDCMQTSVVAVRFLYWFITSVC